MPVQGMHKDFVRWSHEWRKARDLSGGQTRMVGESNGDATGYLPRLGGQTVEQYEAYKRRGSFYNAFARTVEALNGAIFRRAPQVVASEQVLADLENVDLAGTPLSTFAKLLCADVLTVGRYGVLLDMARTTAPGEARPYWAGYCAEDVINWREVRVGGASVLTLVVLRECESVVVAGDEFRCEDREIYRVLDLDESGTYRVRLFGRPDGGADYVQTDEVYPTRQGERLGFIPFVPFGPVTLSITPQRPPLSDLADVNVSHWKMAVDYAHGLHFTALPTPWLGDDNIPGDKVFKIGSQTAWTGSSNMRCGMLEFSGAGMSAIKDAMLDAESRMAHLGAELLTPDKRAAEAADTLRIRSAAKSASLASLSGTASDGLTLLARWHAWWRGESDEAVAETSIRLNQDFVESHMEPAELTAWVQARQAGEVSRRTFLERLERTEALRGRSIDDELDELMGEQDIRREREEMLRATDEARQAAQMMRAAMTDQHSEDEDEDAA